MVACPQGVWDKERGIPAAIGVTNYNVREPATKQSDWSDFTVRALAKFRCARRPY